MSGDQPNLRLELLKLTYSHGRDPSEAVERAKALEEYVLGEVKKGPGRLPKSGDSKPNAVPNA